MLELRSLITSTAKHFVRPFVPRPFWRIYSGHLRRCWKSRSRIRALKNRHAGATIYCLGNGPSLKAQDLSPLNGQTTILTNRAFELLDRFSPEVAYITVQDTERFNELASQLIERNETTFVSAQSLLHFALKPELCDPRFLYCMPAYHWAPGLNQIVPEVILQPGFSRDISQRMYLGYSVIFGAIQIAAYLGARRIVMLGVDMNYTGDPSKDYAMGNVKPLYWNMDYEKHIKPMFEFQLAQLQRDGIELLNATPGSRVDCVPKVELADL